MGQHEEEIIGEAVILNPQGFHARPAMRFFDLASTFNSRISVEKAQSPTERVDGKSVMTLLLLKANRGTTLRIIACGPDAAAAVEALVGLVNRKFDLEEKPHQ